MRLGTTFIAMFKSPISCVFIQSHFGFCGICFSGSPGIVCEDEISETLKDRCTVEAGAVSHSPSFANGSKRLHLPHTLYTFYESECDPWTVFNNSRLMISMMMMMNKIISTFLLICILGGMLLNTIAQMSSYSFISNSYTKCFCSIFS